jgi:hypothetical protein
LGGDFQIQESITSRHSPSIRLIVIGNNARVRIAAAELKLVMTMQALNLLAIVREFARDGITTRWTNDVSHVTALH